MPVRSPSAEPFLPAAAQLHWAAVDRGSSPQGCCSSSSPKTSKTKEFMYVFCNLIFTFRMGLETLDEVPKWTFYMHGKGYMHVSGRIYNNNMALKWASGHMSSRSLKVSFKSTLPAKRGTKYTLFCAFLCKKREF